MLVDWDITRLANGDISCKDHFIFVRDGNRIEATLPTQSTNSRPLDYFIMQTVLFVRVYVYKYTNMYVYEYMCILQNFVIQYKLHLYTQHN